MEEDTVPTPPEQEIDPTDSVLNNFKTERVKLLTLTYGKLAELYSFEKDLMIYRAIKRGYMSAYQMAEVCELTPPVIYKIIERVEKGEYK